MSHLKLSFSTNWNHKLYCTCWTTIRLKNDRKYVRGQVYEVYLKDEFLGSAQLIGIRQISRGKINEYISHLDTGYDVPAVQDILGKMYGRDRDNPYGLYLFKWVKRHPGCTIDLKALHEKAKPQSDEVQN